MGSTNKAISKSARRELAIKQAKKKKITIIVIIAVILVSLIAFFVVRSIMAAGAEVYTDGSQTVNFQEDGSFTANLSHGIIQRGTYAFTELDDRTTVTFNLNAGFSIVGEIADNQLILPVEWQDACGHNFVLPKR